MYASSFMSFTYVSLFFEINFKKKEFFFYRNNLFVIDTVGSHLSKLVRLAFYLTEIQEHIIDYSTKSLFYGLKKFGKKTSGQNLSGRGP